MNIIVSPQFSIKAIKTDNGSQFQNFTSDKMEARGVANFLPV